jgi:TolA-binding protein
MSSFNSVCRPLKSTAMRMVQNALRKEVNRLNEENEKLANEVNQLEKQVQRITEKEEELEQITQQQNVNSNTFIQLIQSNRTTLDELQVRHTLYFTVYRNALKQDQWDSYRSNAFLYLSHHSHIGDFLLQYIFGQTYTKRVPRKMI